MNVKTKHSQTTNKRQKENNNPQQIGKQIQKRNKSFAYCRIDRNNDINEKETRKTEPKSKSRKKYTNTIIDKKQDKNKDTDTKRRKKDRSKRRKGRKSTYKNKNHKNTIRIEIRS